MHTLFWGSASPSHRLIVDHWQKSNCLHCRDHIHCAMVEHWHNSNCLHLPYTMTPHAVLRIRTWVRHSPQQAQHLPLMTVGQWHSRNCTSLQYNMPPQPMNHTTALVVLFHQIHPPSPFMMGVLWQKKYYWMTTGLASGTIFDAPPFLYKHIFIFLNVGNEVW